MFDLMVMALDYYLQTDEWGWHSVTAWLSGHTSVLSTEPRIASAE